MDPISRNSPRTDLNEARRRALEAEDVRPASADPTPSPAPAPAGYSPNSSFEVAPAAAPVSLSPSDAAAGSRRISEARGEYRTARAEVDRLNGHLQAGLQTPALRDPSTAARFRDEFRAANAPAYEREAQTAQTLATAVREAGPGQPRPAVETLAALNTLSTSSEAGQATELAGRLASGANPVIPQGVAEIVARQAADAQLRSSLASGRTAEESANLVGSSLRTAGFASLASKIAPTAELAARFASLGVASAVGGAVTAGSDFSAFARTGDATSAVAGGLQLAGAAGAGLAVAGASAAVTIPLAVVGSGAIVARTVAQQNEYLATVGPSLQRALNVDAESARAIAGQPANVQRLQQLGLSDAQIRDVASNPNSRHVLTRDTLIHLQPHLARATPAERAQLLQGMSYDDVGRAARSGSFGPGMLRGMDPASRELIERLAPARR